MEADRPRFEPATFRMASERSTVKPHRPNRPNRSTKCIIIRPHRIALHKMWAVATDGVAWSVCVCVCVCDSVCVCWSRSCALQNRLKRSRCHLGADSRRPRNHVLDGVEIPTGRGNLGVVRPIQSHWQSMLLCSQQNGSFHRQQRYASKDIIKSLVTARHAMRPFVKILWPLVDLFNNFNCL